MRFRFSVFAIAMQCIMTLNFMSAQEAEKILPPASSVTLQYLITVNDISGLKKYLKETQFNMENLYTAMGESLPLESNIQAVEAILDDQRYAFMLIVQVWKKNLYSYGFSKDKTGQKGDFLFEKNAKSEVLKILLKSKAFDEDLNFSIPNADVNVKVIDKNYGVYSDYADAMTAFFEDCLMTDRSTALKLIRHDWFSVLVYIPGPHGYRTEPVLFSYLNNTDIDIFKEFLKKININSESVRPYLYDAVKSLTPELVYLMVGQGLDPDSTQNNYTGPVQENYSSYDYSTQQVKNNSLLHAAVRQGNYSIVMPLIKSGADPTLVKQDFDFVATNSSGWGQNYLFQKNEPSSSSALELLENTELEQMILNYLHGYRLPKAIIMDINKAIYENDADRILEKIKPISISGLCRRDLTILRRSWFALGNIEYARKKYALAIQYFQNAIAYSFSNALKVSTKEKLQKFDLSLWEKEPVEDAPLYYILYNISCCYSLMGNLPESSAWLKMAVQNNSQMASLAWNDTDLVLLRSNKLLFENALNAN